MSLDIAKVRTYVKNKFINSDYIKRRIKPETPPQYYDEEVEFWTQQIINSNWDLTFFDIEFDKTYIVDHSKSLSKIAPNDYIGQTFKIDGIEYPDGMYISSIGIYTAKEDTDGGAPLKLDIRPLINGQPSNVPLHFSVKSRPPERNRVVDGVTAWQSDPNTILKDSLRIFEFDFPVFVSPGYYCFTLSTSSSKYSVYISENGKGTLDSGAFVTNPYIGDYIYSGQGESWVIDPTKDLCFMLNKAVFQTGTKSLKLNTAKTDFSYDTFNLRMLGVSEVSEKAYIESITTTVKEIQTENETVIPTLANKNISAPSRSTAFVDSGVMFNVTLVNKNENLTPIIDLNQVGVALAHNYIDSYSQKISDSELTTKGLADAKYITKPVILNDGFDADGITIYIDVNTPDNSQIEVFYRILNKYDSSIAFGDSPWYRCTRKNAGTLGALSSDYVEYQYEDLDITYVGSNGIIYNSFNQLAVKVVFYSDNPTKVPTIKNLRVIATV